MSHPIAEYLHELCLSSGVGVPEIAALLDPETSVEGVTTLKVHPHLKGLGELAVSHGAIPGPSQPRGKNAPITPDLAIAARWGYAGQGGVTMPGP
ncbi:MAG: hypothetical protein IAE77_23135, partial [Prosthecobacter sp.]|uniref:hypothetical protein n=1 Tax=Prosthecobacter sp. TaxID=1965333 RepID=UPI0019EA1E5A